MDDLKYIKKHYGEKFAHICRSLFPTLLEQEGLLSSIIEENFGHSKNLVDIIDTDENLSLFKNFIYDCATNINEEKIDATPDDVVKMFDEAGYILYPECKTEAEIQAFRHYYNRLENGPTPIYTEGQIPTHWTGEELCTFNGGRLNSCRVWFAVKKEVSENEFAIKRSETPERQDKYGTSVISIQWSKLGKSTLSIKNRYNHSVNNPDATFSNNLDNICPCLHASFCSAFNIEAEQKNNALKLEGLILGGDGKYYLINKEINGIRYCDNNTVIMANGEVKHYDPERYIVLDGYTVDLKEKLIVDNYYEKTVLTTKKISVTSDKNSKERILSVELEDGSDLTLTLNKRNIVTKMASTNMVNMPSRFLYNLENLEEIDFPSLQAMYSGCFFRENYLKKINLPKLEFMEQYCFSGVGSINSLSLPMLKKMQNNCFEIANGLQNIYLPILETMDHNCFSLVNNLQDISLPLLKSMKKSCFEHAHALYNINLPIVEKIDMNCFHHVYSLQELNMPNLKNLENCCFSQTKDLQTLNLPSLETMGNACFYSQNSLITINLPNLKKMNSECFNDSPYLQYLNLPNLEVMKDCCFMGANSLQYLNLPQVKKIGRECFRDTQTLQAINLPMVEELGDFCFRNSTSLNAVNAPNLDFYGNWSFESNPEILNKIRMRERVINFNEAVYSVDDFTKQFFSQDKEKI